MHLKNTVLNTIKAHLHGGWVSDHYDWKKDFVYVYCSDWYGSALECFDAIDNDATIYSNILYYVTKSGYAYTNTVDLFNTYVYLYAWHALEEDPDILSIIRNIHRIKQLRKTVPLVLNRYMHTDAVKEVKACLGEEY